MITDKQDSVSKTENRQVIEHSAEKKNSKGLPVEIGGRNGLEPTRYGDWEKNGRCVDF